MMTELGRWCPTPEEIRQACEAIRARKTEHELRKMAGEFPRPVEVTECSLGLSGEADIIPTRDRFE